MYNGEFKRNMNTVITSGNYLNVAVKGIYGEIKKDVFIIFNEPNDEPTGKELDIITASIEKILESPAFSEITTEKLETIIDEQVESLDLPCIQFGIQVIVK